MADLASNPALIRVAILVFILVITILRARKSSTTTKPSARPGAGRSTVGDVLRELKRQAVEQQARKQRGELPPMPRPFAESQAFRLNTKLQQPSLQQPPAIQPESSVFPSVLLLALLVCLLLMAYRYWAG